MSNWDDIRYFVAVAQIGTLSGAARSLGVDHATVSRRLAALESEFDVRLVDRLPRSCRLTAIGREVFERALEMDAAAHGIARLTQAAHAPFASKVTLSAPPVLVTHLFAERLTQFQAKHPEIRLSIAAEGQQVSLSRREADVAVRLVRPTELSTVARKIGTMAFGLYALRSYARLTPPEKWQFIAFDQSYAEMPQQRWLLDIAGGRQVACELNHISEHHIAARAGVGIAGLPCFIGARDRDLIQINEGIPPFSRDIWLLVHRDLSKTPTARAVMDFVAATVSEQQHLAVQ